jgi:predicted acylesterase/phospholipase RssA
MAVSRNPDELQAAAIADGAHATLDTVEGLADRLRADRRSGPIAPLLVALGRRALYEGWESEHRQRFAALLRDHQQFGYARRLLGRVRRDGPDTELLRQQHAICTYKDLGLSAARRLDRALAILADDRRLDQVTSAESLGIAGAIYKRRWEVDAKRADLEMALYCYEAGFALRDDPDRWYPGINAAFVADQLAALEAQGPRASAQDLIDRADEIRREIVADPPPGGGAWRDETLGEALFGLGRFGEAQAHLAAAGRNTTQLWKRETAAMQIAALMRLRGFEDSQEAQDALRSLVGGRRGAFERAQIGKVGVALSGGGYRASLFHIGVLARLAECGVLRHVEVLSCVSGGSIVGAFYYLKLRRLLESTKDEKVTDAHYVELVNELAGEFLDGVRANLRGQLLGNAGRNWRMLASRYSRTTRVSELLEAIFYAGLKEGRDDPPWRMKDLFITPRDEPGFSLRYQNWQREAKVPILVLNATTLNTGHGWQFTASWMGEPPSGIDEHVDASRRLRRMYYDDAPEQHRELALCTAVAASACVPTMFPPVTLERLYGDIDVELVDGGNHDNQGIASLLEQDCSVILVSDASGQIRDDEHPKRGFSGVARRSNAILMSRVRGAQYADLVGRRRAGTLRGLMIVHLRKGLPADPRDWSSCQEPYDPVDDAGASDAAGAAPAYAIDATVQRALAELRTDLDAFSDAEAYALMAAGYEMARCELPRALRDLPNTGAAFKPAGVTWPFTPMLAKLAEPAAVAGLSEELRRGHALFFRRFSDWRRQRAEQRNGRLLPAAATGVRRGVVTPIRAVGGLPLAALAALGTRLYLRGRGR